MTETVWLENPKIFTICLLQKKLGNLSFSQWNITQPTSEKNFCEDLCGNMEKYLEYRESGEGNFLWKRNSPLMSLKYLHHKEGGRQMLRSVVTMVIWGTLPGPLTHCPPAQMGLSGMGIGWWFQIPREGLAGKPACQPTSQTSARRKLWKSLAHKYVPC